MIAMAAGLTLLTGAVRAQDNSAVPSAQPATLSYAPPQSMVCDPTGVVNKAKLASYLLTKFPVSAAALTSVGPLDPSTFERLLQNGCPAGSSACSKTDMSQITAAQGDYTWLMQGRIPGYKVADQVGPATYFQPNSTGNNIQCVAIKGSTPDPKVVQPKTQTTTGLHLANVRVRGNANDLAIDQSDSADFKGTSPATVSFSHDGVAQKTSAALTGYFGYDAFHAGTVDNWFEIVPYVGINRSVVTTGTGAKAKTVATDTVDPGILGSIYVIGDKLSHIINVRPDLLFDLVNDSTLASMNLQYIPVFVPTPLNSYYSLERWGPPVMVKIVLDARADLGTYTDRGLAAVASMNRDYTRIGGQGGIMLLSLDTDVPLTFSSTYTGMYGAWGGVNIGDFSNVLTFYLDKDKNAGISASYANGVREDTGKRENIWMVGLSYKY
jgi:hypothetical protein